MKRLLLLLLVILLGVSLWFNWRTLTEKEVSAPAPSAPPIPAPSPGHKLPDAIDFSGTGFDDKAWTLEAPQNAAPIPNEIPSPGLPTPPPPPADWNPDIPLNIGPSE